MFCINKYIVILLGSIIMSSCNSNDFDYSEYRTINQQKFKYSDTLKYEFAPLADSTYKLYLSVRYSDLYEFSNLWLRIHQGDKIVRVEIPLFDKTGKPLGECTGGICTKTILWKLQNFNNQDTVKWNVVQNMRKDPLESISEVGLLIKIANSQ